MSNVVPFKQKTHKKVMVRKPDDTGRILIYTGIRYVRDEAGDDYGAGRGTDPALASAATERLQA